MDTAKQHLGRGPDEADMMEQYSVIRKGDALAGVAQWNERRPWNQRVLSSIPSPGTCLHCGPGSQQRACERQPHMDVSPSLSPSLPLCLKLNKIFKNKRGKEAAIAYRNEVCGLLDTMKK